jgi:diguanylate cyclase (GGDEF)-like protein
MLTMRARAGRGTGEDDPSPHEDALSRRLMSELEAALAELAKARDRIVALEAKIDEDPLLPVLNRRGFLRELERAVAYVSRYRRSASLIYIDLNGLKAINDRLGHAAGDRVLIDAAALLAANIRRSDLIGRLGGDEFAVLLHEADLATATRKAEELDALAQAAAVDFEGRTLSISFSWGVTALSDADDAASALARADAEMYRHKKAQGASRDS